MFLRLAAPGQYFSPVSCIGGPVSWGSSVCSLLNLERRSAAIQAYSEFWHPLWVCDSDDLNQYGGLLLPHAPFSRFLIVGSAELTMSTPGLPRRRFVLFLEAASDIPGLPIDVSLRNSSGAAPRAPGKVPGARRGAGFSRRSDSRCFGMRGMDNSCRPHRGIQSLRIRLPQVPGRGAIPPVPLP
jgi:hypothetical protein